MVLIGYSGHAFVACGIATAMGMPVDGYCDQVEKAYNPFGLSYLGTEQYLVDKSYQSFIAIGDNGIRKKVASFLAHNNIGQVNLVHPSAIIAGNALLPHAGIMICPGVIVNPLAHIGTGTICNSGSVIEHECVLGDFSHIGPGAILCGNVTIGAGTFIGAGSVIRQGINIGSNAMIGAGSVVVKDVPDNVRVMGNPAR